jgi:hypothetical protein
MHFVDPKTIAVEIDVDFLLSSSNGTPRSGKVTTGPSLMNAELQDASWNHSRNAVANRNSFKPSGPIETNIPGG